MSIWILLSLALSVAVGFFLAAPFFEPTFQEVEGGLETESYAALMDKKERALRALKDLELDHTMGKVGQGDFERSKRELSIEVAEILEEIRRHG